MGRTNCSPGGTRVGSQAISIPGDVGVAVAPFESPSLFGCYALEVLACGPISCKLSPVQGRAMTTPIPRMIPMMVLTAALSTAGLQGADMPEPISYTLRFPAPQTHYVEVEAHFPTDGQPTVELVMAVWTPGSY